MIEQHLYLKGNIFITDWEKYRKNILRYFSVHLNPDKSTVYVIGGNVAFFRKAIM